MPGKIEWTYLPWLDQDLAGTVCYICVLAGVLLGIIFQIIRRTSLGYDIHQAPFLNLEVTVYALAINISVYSLFFWYIGAAVSLFFSFLFYISARGMQKKIYHDEKDGKWGLYPPLRQVRGELFSDLTEEEQLSYKATVDQTYRRLSPLWYFPLTVIGPFLIMLLLKLFGMPFVLFPQAIS